MKRTIAAVFLAVTSLLITLPAHASAPAEGLVIEGVSVPDVALGDSRALIEAVWGPPLFCQNVQTIGDQASCSFPVEGGGTVNVTYRGPLGGNASNSPDDVVFSIRWYEQVDGWETTAGVNTALAANNPQAVIDAYPEAEVIYNSFGGLYSVKDYEQGIEVLWVPDFYSGTTLVNMRIFNPSAPPPPVEKLTLVTEIDLTVTKGKGGRQIRAFVRVQDERGASVHGAAVQATWESPNATTLPVTDVTSRSGYAYFEILKAARGTYTLYIDDVILEGYEFDEGNSVLSASVTVK